MGTLGGLRVPAEERFVFLEIPAFFNTLKTTVAQRCQAKYKRYNTNTKATTQIQKSQHKYKSHNTNTKSTTEVNNNGSDHRKDPKQK